MSSHCSSICTSADGHLDTKIKLYKATYIWTIENFKFHDGIGKPITSSSFSALDDGETKWKLNLTPNNNFNGDDHVSFYVNLSVDSVHKEAFADLYVCILDKTMKETSSFQRSRKVRKFIATSSASEPGDIGVSVWGWCEFQKKDENFKNNLLVDDRLTFKCVIKYFIPVANAIDNTLHECKKKNTQLYPNIPECNISDQFGLLFENRDFADVILSINGTESPAHKYILAARSRVFAAMFKHDAKENEENRVNIDDMDEEVVTEMLRYIYTGKCERLSELAYGLLAAGDKYDLDHLKMISAEELYKNLSVENAASILVLADMHGVRELKNGVIEFIISKPVEVFGTEGWKSVRSNFNLADEVTSLALARQLKPKD
ncbi:speckle-type POZ protein B-like [Planococcus citri]|uniref:speckle-type POZ protein B-like n=1 Tax=Planococcus citri TaxID=170843 RepID=UPI0031F9ECAA